MPKKKQEQAFFEKSPRFRFPSRRFFRVELHVFATVQKKNLMTVLQKFRIQNKRSRAFFREEFFCGKPFFGRTPGSFPQVFSRRWKTRIFSDVLALYTQSKHGLPYGKPCEKDE